jgi:uncharacterized membrane protein YbhN (UPF0104 family)
MDSWQREQIKQMENIQMEIQQCRAQIARLQADGVDAPNTTGWIALLIVIAAIILFVAVFGNHSGPIVPYLCVILVFLCVMGIVLWVYFRRHARRQAAQEPIAELQLHITRHEQRLKQISSQSVGDKDRIF